MKAKIELFLVGLAFGRIALHLAGLILDRHFKWHLAGITRELRRR